MARVPLEDLPSNLVPESDLPMELSASNIVPEDDLPTSILKKERSITEKIGRGLSSVARGAAVPLTGAAAGGALAGPAGAVAGSLALPAAELITKGLNAVLPDKYDIPSPTAQVEKGLTRLGFPQPETQTERALQVGGGALGGVGGQVGALGQLAQTAASPVARGVAQTLSQQPVRQVAAALPVGATSQYVAEETGSPTLGLAAGVAAGIPFAMGAKGTLQAPTVQELKGQAGQQYKFAEDVGAVFKKNSYNQFANKLESTLAKEGLDKALQPRVFAALERIKDTKNSNVTLENMEILRRISQAAGSSADASERRLASIMVDNLDDFDKLKYISKTMRLQARSETSQYYREVKRFTVLSKDVILDEGEGHNDEDDEINELKILFIQQELKKINWFSSLLFQRYIETGYSAQKLADQLLIPLSTCQYHIRKVNTIRS